MAYAAEAAAALEDRETAAVAYDLLRPFAAHNVVLGYGTLALGSAARYLGLAASTLQRWPDALAHLEDAEAMNRRMRARPALARTQLDHAGALLGRAEAGDRARAAELVGRAAGVAEDLDLESLRRAAARLEAMC
jgi:hypothetical protein